MPIKSPSNVTVIPYPDESIERTIQRFFRKCKKLEIVKEHIDKTAFYKTKSQKRKEKILKNKFFKQKKQKKFN